MLIPAVPNMLNCRDGTFKLAILMQASSAYEVSQSLSALSHVLEFNILASSKVLEVELC